MRPDDLHSFISLIDHADQLARIEVPVDPHLEIATIIDRVSKGDGEGKALFFDQVRGTNLPLVANLFGSRQRVAWALGTTDLKGLAERLARDLGLSGEKDSATALARVAGAEAWQSEKVASAAWSLDDRTEEGFDALPVLHFWPEDGGRYLTLGQVFTRHPESGLENCGMYRIQVLAKDRAAIRCHPGSGAGEHLDAWRALGEPMPVAIVLGGPPILTWAAGVPLPEDVMEAAFVGYLTGRPLQVVESSRTGLSLPASAEMVIEGTIDPGETVEEGPFGNHTGAYAPPAEVPLFRLERLTLRSGAIYPTTLVGPPPMEDLHLAEVTERLLLPLLQFDHPWVVDLHMPLEGIFHRGAFVQVSAGDERPLSELCDALWGSLLLRNSRLMILFDEEVDLSDPAQLYWRVINAGDWSQHLLRDEQKLVIDARTASGLQGVRPDPDTLEKVLARWKEYGL